MRIHWSSRSHRGYSAPPGVEFIGGQTGLDGNDAVVQGFQSFPDGEGGQDDTIASAYLFHRNGNTWTFVRKLAEGFETTKTTRAQYPVANAALGSERSAEASWRLHAPRGITGPSVRLGGTRKDGTTLAPGHVQHVRAVTRQAARYMKTQRSPNTRPCQRRMMPRGHSRLMCAITVSEFAVARLRALWNAGGWRLRDRPRGKADSTHATIVPKSLGRRDHAAHGRKGAGTQRGSSRQASLSQR